MFSSRLRTVPAVLATLLLTCNGQAALRQKEALPAVVALSDGTTLRGDLAVMGSRPLVITPVGGKRQKPYLLADILSLDHRPEKATMERPWTFKEAGRHDKIYFEGQYPLINFVTTVRLLDGTVFEGHVISAVLTLRTPDGKQKFFLKRQIKGEVGQDLDDLVYITQVRFPENRPAEACKLSGSVTGYGVLQAVNAFDAEREQMLRGTVTGDRFDFGFVLPGSYDVTVRTPTHVLTGFCTLVPKGVTAGEPLAEADTTELARLFPLADDFFNDRWIVRTQGTHSYTKTLVYKRRAHYYDAAKLTPGGYLWHLEAWSWHRAGDDWKIDKRFIMMRHRQTGDEAVRRLVILPGLTACRPNSTIRITRENHGDAAKGTFVRDLD